MSAPTPTYPVSAFDFDLPADRIAQAPTERRDTARLMVVDRATGTLEHRTIADLATLIPPGDVLVRNTTRVLRARLRGTRDSGAPAEVLLLKPLGDHRWEAMVHPGGKLRPGRTVDVAPGLAVDIEAVTERRTRVVRLRCDGIDDDVDAIERHGHVPLPPYITRAAAAADTERYQTVYAREAGSVAAPTAGLHFTPELLATLEARGVAIADVLLHVGAGTFRPVDGDDVRTHVMHEEWYRVGAGTAAQLAAARARGAHVWAVGTTTVRTLESACDAEGRVQPGEGDTRLFIYPPYRVRSVDRLLTNFHLPRSTLLMMIAAIAGYDLTMEAYRTAVREGYRFYSYGDAMLVR